ncbi:glycosyltransferase [Cellulomonas composti]|uniref:Uncharacterized protein n=1 Tax=Cellulomonas composti TaxID=266130 RepID=A0A511JB13_9CELL|nr:glycosyltransferase [Cellulomonas composti]GEL95164.1 hypothetical protein CCO02nite_18220 [Cellulomonas composti]
MVERPVPDRPGRLVVVTPWYPTSGHPYWGVFVRRTTQALLEQFPDPLVVHVSSHPPGTAPAPAREVVDGIEVLRVPFETEPAAPRDEVARLTRAALEPHADELAAATAVHVHVGLPTGWAVVDLVGERVPVLVTEHASYVNRLLSEPATAALYAQTVRGAAAFSTVNEDLTRVLRGRYPDRAATISTVHNVIDVERLTEREHPPRRFDRWLYVGNVLEAKGVLRLVRAFAAWRARRPAATLTIAGAGVDLERMRALADELGVLDAVTFLGRVDPTHIAEVYHRADLMVHLSRSETFGMASAEALATGLPVVATATRGGVRTLDVAQDLWMSWLVDVGEDVEPVLVAVEGLEARLGSARPHLVREDLAFRFGPAAVGADVGRLLRGEPAPEPDPDAPLVVAIALHRSALRRSARIAQDAARRGARAVLVADSALEADVDDRVRVLEVGDVRYDMITHRLERWGLDGIPRVLLAVARPFARALGREATIDALGERQRAAGLWWRRAVGERLVHAHVDPLVLGRYVLREHAEAIADPTVVVWGDPRGIPLAARIARAYTNAQVIPAMHHDAVVELLREAAAGRDEITREA